MRSIKNMKTYCKHVDPSDPKIISIAFTKFLKGKTNRNAIVKWIVKFTQHSRTKVKRLLHERDTEEWYALLDEISNYLSTKIKNKQLAFPAITVTARKDKCSGKIREIGTQSVEQSVVDHILVFCMQDLFKRIGRNQMASIPGRGCLRGARRIAGWLKNENALRYYAKLDVKKCYESIKVEHVLAFISKYVKNEKILYVLKAALSNHKNGLSIGSYLSQWLSNLYMSQLYHFIEDRLFSTRRGKKIRYVTRMLFYMDDILLLSRNKRNLAKAINAAIYYAGTLGLRLLVKINITDISETEADKLHTIPMLGFRIGKGALFLSKKIWHRAKRICIKYLTALKRQGGINIARARLFTARFGYILHGVTTLQKSLLCVKYIQRKVTGIISNHAKSQIYRTATAGS